MVELTDGTTQVYDGNMKLPELVAWLKPFALSEKIQLDNAKTKDLEMK